MPRHKECPAKCPRKRACERGWLAPILQGGSSYTPLPCISRAPPWLPGSLSRTLMRPCPPEPDLAGDTLETRGPRERGGCRQILLGRDSAGALKRPGAPRCVVWIPVLAAAAAASGLLPALSHGCLPRGFEAHGHSFVICKCQKASLSPFPHAHTPRSSPSTAPLQGCAKL